MTHEQLTPNELIWLFIDGAASPDESDMLFSSLAGNAELQQDFHHAITLRSALEHSRERTAVPPLLTNKVMSAAGVTIGGAIATATWWSSIRGALGVAFQKGALPLASATLASLVTWFVMSENSTMSSASTASSTTSASSSSAVAPLPDNSSAAAPRYATEAPLQPKERIRYVYRERPQPALQATPHNNNEENTSLAQEADNSSGMENSMADNMGDSKESQLSPNLLSVAYQQQAATFSSLVPNTQPSRVSALRPHQNFIAPDSIPVRQPSQYTVSVRGISGLTMYPYRDMVGSATMFNNITGILSYSLTKHHAVGMEIGTETFPMYALDQSQDGIWNFTQKPQMMFGGLHYQYTGSSLEEFSALQPVLRGFVGGTNWGPLLKGTVGLQYNPNDMITLGLGMEGTALWYTQQSQWFSTQKLSFTYWIGLRL